jgi:hypothetical protein
LLNVFSEWLKIKADKQISSKQWCKKAMIEEQRLYEMVKLTDQFRHVMKQVGFDSDPHESEEEEMSREVTLYL